MLGSEILVFVGQDQINSLDHRFNGPTCTKASPIETKQILGLQNHIIHNMLLSFDNAYHVQMCCSKYFDEYEQLCLTQWRRRRICTSMYVYFLNMNSDSGACSKEMGLILWSRISTSANFRWMAVVMQRELQHEAFLNSQIYKFTIIFGKELE